MKLNDLVSTNMEVKQTGCLMDDLESRKYSYKEIRLRILEVPFFRVSDVKDQEKQTNMLFQS